MTRHHLDVLNLLRYRGLAGTTEVGPSWAAPPPGFGLYGGQLVRKTRVGAMGVGEASEPGGGLVGTTHVHVEVLPEDKTVFDLSRRLGIPVEQLILSNPHKATMTVHGVKIFTRMIPSEIVLAPRSHVRMLGEPSTLGAPMLKSFKPGATAPCGKCTGSPPPMKSWLPPGMKLLSFKYVDTCGCQRTEYGCYGEFNKDGQHPNPWEWQPNCPAGTTCYYAIVGGRMPLWMCLGPQGTKVLGNGHGADGTPWPAGMPVVLHNPQGDTVQAKATLTQYAVIGEPSTLGAPTLKPFKPGATQPCQPCPPYSPWNAWDKKNAQLNAPAGMEAQVIEHKDSCGCQAYEVYYSSGPYEYGTSQPAPMPPAGFKLYAIHTGRGWGYICLTPKGAKLGTSLGWKLYAVSQSKPNGVGGAGTLGDPCNPFDYDFNLSECMSGGGGSGSEPGGGAGGGITTSTPGGGDGGFFDTDEKAACENIGGTWTGDACLPSGQFTPGDPTAPDPGSLPPWVQAGMAACAKQGMDYDAANDLCAPKGSTYGPKGEPAKGSVPVGGGGTGGGKPGGGGGGMTTPPKGPDVKTVTTADGKGMKGLLIVGGVLAAAVAVGGGAYYISKRKKKGHSAQK